MGLCEKVGVKVKMREAEEKRRDPLAVLPLELINMVFSLLDFRSVMCVTLCSFKVLPPIPFPLHPPTLKPADPVLK